MPPKKYTMDDLDKKFDEKLSSVKFNLVSDLKKEIRNLATLSDKDKEIEVLRSQVTLLQNHVSTVKDALDKKVDELEQHGRRVCLRIEGVEHQANEKSKDVLEKAVNIIRSLKPKFLNQFWIELIALALHILIIIRGKRCKA